MTLAPLSPRRRLGAALLLAASCLVALPASAQTAVRVRGVITAVEPGVLSVKSRTGEDLKLAMADDVGVAVATAVKFEDIKAGDYVGSAAVKGADGRLVALEVHYLAPNVPAGHTPWDLQPGSTMTNANVVEAMVGGTGGRELTLKHKDGEQKIVVPPNAPIVRAVPGTRADLKVGETVFVAAQSADGKLKALRVQVSRDGVKPPQ
jgi:hypothetical protein